MNQILMTEDYCYNKREAEPVIEGQVKKVNSFKRTKTARADMKNLLSMLIVFCICILFSYCIYAYGLITKDEEQVEEVAIEAEEKNEEKAITETIVAKEFIGLENTEYTSNGGETYNIIAILNIPSLGIKYPVLSENSDELMEISLNKFWGAEPNEEGNCVIVGHNYLNKTQFGKLPGIKLGDEVEITDSNGRTVTYVVYDMYNVQPENVECTTQLTDGRTEATLITCTNGGATRLVVKCVAIEK